MNPPCLRVAGAHVTVKAGNDLNGVMQVTDGKKNAE